MQALFDGGEGGGQAKPKAERSVYAMLYEAACSAKGWANTGGMSPML